MREIKFRGKLLDNGEWVDGSLINNAFYEFITNKPVMYIFDNKQIGEYDCFSDISEFIDLCEVIPETVGQFTGLQDKSGIDIYEGDIVMCNCDEDEVGAIVWDNDDGMWTILIENIIHELGSFYSRELEVIGNIHDINGD